MFDINRFLFTAMKYSPHLFINHRQELIIVPTKNIYFRLDNIETEKDLQIKIFEWLSRPACKGVGNYWQSRIRKIINEYLKTQFSTEDFELIYTRLGNGVNRELCEKFVTSGFDLSVLEDRKGEE